MSIIKKNSRHFWVISLSILSLLLTAQSTVAQTSHKSHRRYQVASAWRDVSAPGEFNIAQQTTIKLHVDHNNQTGVEDGSVARPFRAIQQAIDSTLEGEAVIYIAGGEYNEHLTIQNKQVHLFGGFQGASANAYATGQPGNFTAADPTTYITTITGYTTNAVVTLINARESVVDGFVIMGGAGRLINQEHQGGGVYCQGGSPTVSNNFIEGNDTTTPQQTGAGGGIYAIDAAITIVNNTIQNNHSGHGGGIAIENGLGALIKDNTIQQNTAVHYLGEGGISVSNSTVTLTKNYIQHNENAIEYDQYGGGAGISLRGTETSATCSYNTIAKNISVGYGAGFDINDGANAVLDHELIYQNHRMEDSYAIGGTIAVAGRDEESPSIVSLTNCTIADNNQASYVGGNGIYARDHCNIEVLNSIFWGNNQDDFLLEGQKTLLEVRYSNSEEPFKGEGNLSLDPAFANPDREDYHLKSMAGRWDPQKDDGMGGWVIDDVNSPCIDAGHSSSPWEREPSPNGGRVNMGCYGNTGEASLLYIPPTPKPRDPCRFPLSFAHHCVEDRVPVLLHPQPDCPINKEVTVSFGMPFPICMIADPKLLRVEDQRGKEIPAFVETLLPWRDLSTGTDFSYIRSALIQFPMTFKDTSTPVEVIIEIGSPRTKSIDTKLPVRDNWTLVDDRTFPAKYGVYEPIVYATLPPCWLCACAIKSVYAPYGTFEHFHWYDESLSNVNPNSNDGQNFFRTMINDDDRIADGSDGTINTIHYLKPGNENNDGDYEPWLYDRAMTMYGIYIRSGKIDVLRQAHRNTFYYASQLDDEGYFNMKWSGGKPARDLKYSYAESLLTDIIFTGDKKLIQDIKKLPLAASRFDYAYDPQVNDFWTERHFAFSWLIYIVAYEATGNEVYAEEARKRAETVFHYQQHPPSHPDHGQAPITGALMHSFQSHEGWWDESHPYWVFSPWMTTLLVDAMQRYYQHSADERVLESAQRFGDAVMDSGMAIRDDWPDFGGYLIEGLPVPHYLAGSERGYYEWSDYEHCLDVAKTTAFAYHCSILSHAPNSKYLHATDALLESARVVLDYWIRPAGPDYGKSIYRLAPPRKGNWWFRTTQDIDYLTQFENVSVDRWIDY